MEIDVAEFVKTKKPRKKKVDTGRSAYLISGAILLGVLLVTMGIVAGVRTIANWGSTHKIVGQRVIDVEIRLPYRVEEIKPVEVLGPLAEAILKTIDDPLSKTQTAVMEKFGAVEFKVVNAVIKCESNYSAEAMHYNSNGTFDAGLMQINQVHWNTDYCPYGLKDLLDEKNNIECGYQIYLRHGKSFEAWSSVGNGCVADKL